MIARGTEDEKGVITLVGTIRDVLTPEGRPYKHVSWKEGPDRMVAHMYDTMPDGTEWVVMEMVYLRRK